MSAVVLCKSRFINFMLFAGGLSSLDVYERERLGSRYGSGDQVKVLDSQRDNHGTELEEELVDTTLMELRDLLRRAVKSAVSQVAENPEMWSPHPATTLVTLMIDRLETPHEMAMTMEQYEEVSNFFAFCPSLLPGHFCVCLLVDLPFW